MSDQKTVDSSEGESPWVPGEPSETNKPDQKFNCATIYGKYNSYLGRFDDMSCSSLEEILGIYVKGLCHVRNMKEVGGYL